MNLQRLLIWLLLAVEGLVLLFDADQRAKYNFTVSYFLQFQDQFLETVASDVRYAIAFFLLLPLIAGDFLFIKLFAIVAYCMNVVIVENLYLRVDGAWDQLGIHEWLQCAIKFVILFLAFEALIMSILDEQPIKPQPQQKAKIVNPKVQNKKLNTQAQKTKTKKA